MNKEDHSKVRIYNQLHGQNVSEFTPVKIAKGWNLFETICQIW
jgi:hypothetical protein